MSEWQPIETAPKDGTRIMLWIEPGHTSKKPSRASFGRWHQPGNPRVNGFWITEAGSAKSCPFWQPVPEPPSLTKGEP